MTRYCKTCGQPISRSLQPQDKKWLALIGRTVRLRKGTKPTEFKLLSQWDWSNHTDAYRLIVTAPREVYVADESGPHFWGFPKRYGQVVHFRFKKSAMIRVIE